MEERISPLRGFLALSPLIMFLLLYLALSLLVGDFYAMPITVAFLLSCLYSLVVLRGRSVSDRFQVLTEGASSPSLLLMEIVPFIISTIRFTIAIPRPVP